jgi:hypothetical protein
MAYPDDAHRTGPDRPASRIDTTIAHPARRYNYWLGGKDHFAADRASGDRIAEAFPHIRTAAIENRRFLGRAVDFLAKEAGIRQFLDIGTGIPAVDNTHQVAQAIDPTCRVVYVDNDPIVLTHARALLTSQRPETTAYLDADLRTPGHILDHPDLAATLDLTQPVALLLIAVLHFLTDQDHPHTVVDRLVGGLPAGSYLAISHATYDFMPPDMLTALQTATVGEGPFQPRTRDQIADFFHGMDLAGPGLVPVTEWPTTDPTGPTAVQAAAYGAIAVVR